MYHDHHDHYTDANLNNCEKLYNGIFVPHEGWTDHNG
jgi:hypothetical protein